MSATIEVQDLTKRYKNAKENAVDGISFSVQPGEFFTLIGPNGAGKTTTISILTTTLSLTSGRVTVAGYDSMREASQVRQQIGIIFQKPSLDLNLTSEENVRFHAILYGLYPFRPLFSLMPATYRNTVKELAAVLEMDEVMTTPVKKLSGGMKRRLEILRSLLHHPKVLFLDEPTAGLDPRSRRRLWDYLQLSREQRDTTVFLTTHYLEEAENADTVCILHRGKVAALGTPAHVKGALGRDTIIVDAEDREALRAELAQLAVPVSGGPPYRLALQGHTVHQLLKKIETPLNVVQTYTPTLEDAYLKIVEGEQ